MIPIAIRHPSASYRVGLASCLDDSFEVEEPSKLASWLQGPAPRVAAIYLDTEDSWESFNAAVRSSSVTVVALLPSLDPSVYSKVLATGAAGVAQADLSPDLVARTIEGALVGEVILPQECARYLAGQVRDNSSSEDILDSTEISIITAYAGGESVSELARRHYFGERTVRRKLQNICLKLGVRTRQEAIARAVHLGLLK